jgi:predicted transcriptional regulator
MARTPLDVTDAELSVLEVLWDKGPATVRQISDVLYPGGGASKHATVLTLLQRLEKDNRYVKRDRRGGVQLFAATIDRAGLIARRLDRIAERLCGGSLTPLLTHLVKSERLSEQELQSLRDLIDELDPDRAGQRRPRRPSR